jgi:hypothetical protein
MPGIEKIQADARTRRLPPPFAGMIAFFNERVRRS